MVAVSYFAMYRCLSPQEGTMVFRHSQVPLAPGSLLCVLSLGPAECAKEPVFSHVLGGHLGYRWEGVRIVTSRRFAKSSRPGLWRGV